MVGQLAEAAVEMRSANDCCSSAAEHTDWQTAVPVDCLQGYSKDLVDSVALLAELVEMGRSDCWVAVQMVERCMVIIRGELWAVGEQVDWKMTVEGRKCLQQMKVSRAVGMRVRYS